MENYISCTIVLCSFEDGWEFDKWNYEDLMYTYCDEVLYIPEGCITDFIYTDEGIEINLEELTADDLSDDWYINLQKISEDIYLS